MKKNKLSVLHILIGLGFGGAEKVVLDLISSSKGLDLSVQTLNDDIGMLEIYKSFGINPRIGNIKNKSLSAVIKLIITSIKNVRNSKTQIIHAHMYHSMLFAVILKLFYWKLKIVFTPHNTEMKSKFRELVIFITKPFRSYDILFTENEKTRFYHTKNRSIIPNGINVNAYGINVEKFDTTTFISVGNLFKQKNYLAFLEILNNQPKTFLERFQYLIVGNGVLYQELSRFIETSNLKNCVKLLGTRDDVPQLLNRSHALLMPSLWEGMPITLLEAGSAGLPIISTPVGNIPTVLGGYATLDKFENFPFHMEEFLNDAKSFNIKSQLLNQKIKNTYSIENTAKNHIELYASIVNK